ncbi:hypothetical protein F5Y10DRAFT_287621 [Nemania abortiva]|nr:hypothetical protein F5Y10DRAFT_287621 [Nemania abortiva]
MAFGGEVKVDGMMVDGELVNGGDGEEFGLGKEEETEDDDENYIGLKPKIPFKERADPFVVPDDKKFAKIENYFASLLRSPSLTIEDILEGTFDSHEISLITPHSGPLDIVNWQRRNARRYYENLDTRFGGHPDTLAFKMACLYFGFPVEPLRMGTLPFDLPLDSDPLDTKRDAPYADPLAFLKKYEYEDEGDILGLRGGGADSWIPATPKPKKKKKPGVRAEKAVQEITPEGHEMDIDWDDDSFAVNVTTPTPRSAKRSTGNPTSSVGDGPTNIFGRLPTPSSDNGRQTPGSQRPKSQDALDSLFKDSKNTRDEANRMRELRDRSFSSVHSIFTNPLKPVMPLHGPPLESIIKTGPGMPGVSIAMMTPTEMLQLQREVHSLRFQLLDRTRECPYADCDRYFTFADGEGLDRHVREDHSVLRCFLCDKNEHLLPYYDAEQIKQHFVKEHVSDILETFGGTNTRGISTAQAVKQQDPATSEEEESSEMSSDSEGTQQEEKKNKKKKKKKGNKQRLQKQERLQQRLRKEHQKLERHLEETRLRQKKAQETVASQTPWQLAVDGLKNENSRHEQAPDSANQAKTPATTASKAQASGWGAALTPGRRRRAAPVAAAAAAAAAAATPKTVAAPAQELPGSEEPFDIFAVRNPKPGTWQEDALWIQRAMQKPVAQAVGGAAKRKRATNIDAASGSDVYEYSERSAVTDPVADLDPASPAKKHRTVKTPGSAPPPPTPVAFARQAQSTSVTTSSSSEGDS